MQPLETSKTTSPWTEIFAPPDVVAAPAATEPAANSAPPTAAETDLPAEALFISYNG